MCLVSYHPLGNGEFILASNRDESPLRSDTVIVDDQIGEHRVKYPKDLKGGSWIIISDKDRLICLLNGAFVKHKHNPPYRESRGVIIKLLFEYDSAADFIKDVNLVDIEPFTTVIYDREKLYEFRWDGLSKYVETLDLNATYIWSSSTLYDKYMQEKREMEFRRLLASSKPIDEGKIKRIHTTGSVGDPDNDFMMSRWNNKVKTISTTIVSRKGDEISLDFENFEDGEKEYHVLDRSVLSAIKA